MILKDYQLVTSPVAVPISQSNSAVTAAFELPQRGGFQYEVTATRTGTGAIVKPQTSSDKTNWTDLDGTNAKVTLAADGRYQQSIGPTSTNFITKFPLPRYIRFVCTTGGSDTASITSLILSA